MIRRAFALALAAAALTATLAAPLPGAAIAAPSPAPARDDMSLGNPKARVTVVEYASVGCPHCAAWGVEVWPQFKKTYVDTGKVRFVYREMITGNPTLAGAGFLLARCAGPSRYFQVVDGVYRAQAQIMQSGDAYAPLVKIAKDAGLTEDQFNACLHDDGQIKALQARAKQAEEDGVNSTPTFVVNGKHIEGETTLAALGQAIAQASRRK
ncbi:DsbA family protein [Caulobacter sp. KR2-114]|uniref:DsbA family protein n=1 Tax=Caulobacter sp. KR2-114 TaxID=3400912 RepID=UPI003C0C938A